MIEAEIEQTLRRFVLEARKKMVDQYPPSILHHICYGLMRYLRFKSHPDIDFFRDASFSRFREVLDIEMKMLQKGLSSKPRQAEPLLGGHNGRSLVDTILFICGIILLCTLVRNIGLCDL